MKKDHPNNLKSEAVLFIHTVYSTLKAEEHTITINNNLSYMPAYNKVRTPFIKFSVVYYIVYNNLLFYIIIT